MAMLRTSATTRSTVTLSISALISNGRNPAVAIAVRYSAHRYSSHRPTASTDSTTQ